MIGPTKVEHCKGENDDKALHKLHSQLGSQLAGWFSGFYLMKTGSKSEHNVPMKMEAIYIYTHMYIVMD